MSNERSHTPGPWTVGDYSEANYPRNWPEVAVHVGGPENRGNAIAIVYLGGGGATIAARDGILANATLIAAAPDLLAALESAFTTLQLNLHLFPAEDSEDADSQYEVGGVIEAARAAIAKATGGAS